MKKTFKMQKLVIDSENFNEESLRVMSTEDLKTTYGGFEDGRIKPNDFTSIVSDTDPDGGFCSFLSDYDFPKNPPRTRV